MKRLIHALSVAMLLSFVVQPSSSWLAWSVEEGIPAPPASMAAGSPFSDYTAAAVIYVLIIGLLFSVLIGGGLLILNLGLMSKREEDRIGGRNPSDVAILKGNVWPEQREVKRILPAEEDEKDEPAA
jgi:hypothetical protein